MHIPQSWCEHPRECLVDELSGRYTAAIGLLLADSRQLRRSASHTCKWVNVSV